MSDGVVELQKAMQQLSRAYNAYQGSSFSKYFAAKQMPQLSEEQMKMRQQLLRMMGQLIDSELESAMTDLCAAWLSYKESQNA